MIKKIFHALKNLPKSIAAHKFISGIIIMVIVVSGYFGYKAIFKTAAVTSYATAAVEKGTLIISVSGTGQVSALDQVDIKPKASGDVVAVKIKNGQEVKSGALLVQLDTKDAQKAVRDAQISLEDAQIVLSKLKVSQETDIPTIQDSITTAQNNLTQAHQNGFNEVTNSFLDLPSILDGTRGILYDTSVGVPDTKANMAAYQDIVENTVNSDLVRQMVDQAVSDYNEIVTKYDKNLSDYRSTNRFSPSDQIVSLINETLETSKTLAQLVKDEQNLLDAVVATINQYHGLRTVPAAITQYQSSISTYISKVNSHISSLNSVNNTITSNQQSLTTYQRNLETTQENNPLDLTSQENAVAQRQVALQDAQDALANYYIRAPFDGVIAAVNVSKGDSASSGTAVATIITKQRIAEVSLNEVDAAKIKVGQKVTLTFDAVDGLSISGEVADVDTLGTVSQGVVNYTIKISFDTQDDRVKPGMSASASIIIDAKQNVLLVPSSAIKTNNGTSYVQLLQGTSTTNTTTTSSGTNSSGLSSAQTLSNQTVEVGASNDTMTEILSGVKEGDTVVTQTINSSTSTTSSTTKTSSGGGGFRVLGM